MAKCKTAKLKGTMAGKFEHRSHNLDGKGYVDAIGEAVKKTGTDDARVVLPELVSKFKRRAIEDLLGEPAKGNCELLRGRDFVPVKVAVEYLGVTARRVQQAIIDGKLEAKGTKGNRRVSVESLTAYLPPNQPLEK